VPRHPPFALDNLTTENKMLASTVQFSTNNQPTTINANHQTLRNTTTIRRLISNGMEGQVMPGGSETTTPTLTGLSGCSFRTQQGAIFCRPSPAAPKHDRSVASSTDACTRCLGRCRQRTSQCLRHRAPRSDIRGLRATGRLSPASCSLERR
jgi:hypothetical protein